jgi:hypothetical protein
LNPSATSIADRLGSEQGVIVSSNSIGAGRRFSVVACRTIQTR